MERELLKTKIRVIEHYQQSIEMPKGLREYVSENYDRMSNWSSQPYFMQENNLPEILGWE